MVKRFGFRGVGILIGIVLALGCLWFLVAGFGERPHNPQRSLAGFGQPPLVIAHRGGDRLRPENTLPAFRHAMELGADVLEMDVRLTRDGVAVVIHDETVDRTTNGSGRVQDMTFDALKGLDAAFSWHTSQPGGGEVYRGQGIGIPSLEEVFQAFPLTPIVIEIKPDTETAVGIIGALIGQYQRWDRTLVASFHSDIIRAFRRAYPRSLTAAVRGEVMKFWLLSRLYLDRFFDGPAAVFQVPEYFGGLHVTGQRFIEAAHRRRFDVHVWTVNDPGHMARLIAKGIDGIITGRPDLLLALKPKSDMAP